MSIDADSPSGHRASLAVALLFMPAVVAFADAAFIPLTLAVGVGSLVIFVVPALSGVCAGLAFRGLRRDNAGAVFVALVLGLGQAWAFYSIAGIVYDVPN